MRKIFNNKRGQKAFLGIMMFISIFIVIVQFISPIKEQIETASTSLSCDTADTWNVKATCIVMEMTLLHFIGFTLGGAFVFLTGKWAINNIQK